MTDKRFDLPSKFGLMVVEVCMKQNSVANDNYIKDVVFDSLAEKTLRLNHDAIIENDLADDISKLFIGEIRIKKLI